MSSHTTSHSKGEIDVSHHIIPIRVYAMVFVALAVLMVLTLVAAQIDLTTIGNNVAAMLIAGIKATLVVMFFMNVRNGTQLIKFFALLGFLTLPLFLIMAADYQFREHENEGAWDRRDPGSAMPRMKSDDGPHDKMMINVRPR